MRVFVAGASGAIGQPLCHLLTAAGHEVFATTRTPAKLELLRQTGCQPLLLNCLDEAAVMAAITDCQPDIIIHQLTTLPDGLDPAQMDAARRANAHLRDVGTRHLLKAASATGCTRFIAQSIAFVYADGTPPYTEDAPLRPAGEVSIDGVRSLESQVVNAPMPSVILRYGRLYGPLTGFDKSPGAGAIHTHAAAHAALLAIDRGEGIFNIAEDNSPFDCQRARHLLGFNPAFRLPELA